VATNPSFYAAVIALQGLALVFGSSTIGAPANQIRTATWHMSAADVQVTQPRHIYLSATRISNLDHL
jgi:hypothetical protein